MSWQVGLYVAAVLIPLVAFAIEVIFIRQLKRYNAYLATGHNMLGMSLATATGKLLAEILSEQPTHIPMDAYTPDRFR